MSVDNLGFMDLSSNSTPVLLEDGLRPSFFKITSWAMSVDNVGFMDLSSNATVLLEDGLRPFF